MNVNIATAQNRTGLYPGYGVYTVPSQSRRPAIPRMLYRGHAIRIGKGDEDQYYHQHNVRQYQMHSLNAGFSGKENIPVKDQNSYKIPLHRSFCPRTPSGKWTNYPMTIEVGKYTKGIAGRCLSTPMPKVSRSKSKAQTSLPARSRTSFSLRSSVDLPSRPLPSPLDFTSDTRLYEELQPEIIDIMAARNEVFLSFQNRIESALMNDRDPVSKPSSRLGFSATNETLPYIKPGNQRVRPKTSLFAEDPHSNLLLPVPFVTTTNRLLESRVKSRSKSAPAVTNAIMLCK